MLLGGVGADDQNGIGSLQAGDGTGHSAASQGKAQAGYSWSVAEPGHVVHVVRPQGCAAQLHEHKVLLIGPLGRGENAKSPGPELLFDAFQPFCCHREGQIPASPDHSIASPDEGMG